MIYALSLQFVGLIVGFALLAAHGAALAAPAATQRFLRRMPRSKIAGAGMLALCTIWSYWLAANMDLGEFSPLRKWMLIAIPIGALLAFFYVDEFLSGRALGILALLAAAPLLEAAFLRTEMSRLLLVVLAYAWIVAGMFLIGKPYLLRDAVWWLVETSTRFRTAALSGAVYGGLIIVCALLLWKS